MAKHMPFAILMILTLFLLPTAETWAQEGDPDSQSAPQSSDTSLADVGTAFMYQGSLHDNGNPADGSYNFTFRLYDDAAKANPALAALGPTPLTVNEGRFNIDLDFGSSVFKGQSLWLEIEVNGITLSPLTEITPTPYALAIPGMRTEQNATSPNLIGGYSENIINGGVVGGVISGGGSSGATNEVSANYATVGGGFDNTASGIGAGVGGEERRMLPQARMPVSMEVGRTRPMRRMLQWVGVSSMRPVRKARW